MHPRIFVVKFLRYFKLNRIIGKLYYKYVHGFNAAGKELPKAVEKCFDHAIKLSIASKGDYYEFGIFKGYTFAYACNLAVKKKLDSMRFFGFDSFKGLPEIEGLDITQDMPFYKGQYSAGKEQVIRDISNAGVDWSKSYLIEGFFKDSLKEEIRDEYQMGKISIALIDCDLYSSTVEVLGFIANMIQDKTILIFDDWNTFDKDNERGQRKAFRNFLDVNKHITAEEFFSYGAYGKVFIVSVNTE